MNYSNLVISFLLLYSATTKITEQGDMIVTENVFRISLPAAP